MADLKGYKDMSLGFQSYYNTLKGYTKSLPVSGITSRDDIINPYELLQKDYYKNSVLGQRAYEQDLNMLLAIQAQQQASYDEFYNSEEQQALRQREAGLNPDLLGVESQAAPQTGAITDSPVDGLPTSGQTAMDVVGSVASIIGSMASLAALPSSIGASMASAAASKAAKVLTDSQIVGQNLSNILAFEGASFSGISNMVADAATVAAQAGQAFDFDRYLSETDFTDVFSTYAPEGASIESGSYAAAFRRAKSQVQKHRAAAYKQGKEAQFAQTDFAKELTNPYSNPDILLQIAALEPIGQAMEQIDSLTKQFELAKLAIKQTYLNGIDGDLAAQEFNQRLNVSIAKGKYDVNYFEKFKGDEIAALDYAIKRSQSIISGAASAIKENYLSIWKDKSRNHLERMAAQYMLMDNVSKQWADWLVAYNAANGIVTEAVETPLDPE